MPFTDPVVAGTYLIREAIQSPNYDPGVMGWSINADGSAEFSDVTITGGELVVTDPDGSQVRIYDENPGSGAVVELRPADVTGHTVTAGKIYTDADPGGGYPRVVIRSPQLDASDVSYIDLRGGDDTDVNPAHYGYLFARARSRMWLDTDGIRVTDGNNFTSLIADFTYTYGWRVSDPNGSGSTNFETWHNFPFANGWAAPAAGLTRLRYRKNILNRIEIEGLCVSPNPFAFTVGTLPAGYRPANTIGIYARGSSAPDPVFRITSAGVCEMFGSSTIGVTWFVNGSFSLD